MKVHYLHFYAMTCELSIVMHLYFSRILAVLCVKLIQLYCTVPRIFIQFCIGCCILYFVRAHWEKTLWLQYSKASFREASLFMGWGEGEDILIF